jgi:hypothetical protein
MTKEQFTAAAAEGRRVRLIDRSRTFYVDEWYDPIVDDDGTFHVDTHTGGRYGVGDNLLAKLTTEPAVMTTGDLRDLLDQYPDDTRVVLRSGDNAYGDITPESIGQVLLRPHAGKRPRSARYGEATFSDRTAPDTFDAVRIHAVTG